MMVRCATCLYFPGSGALCPETGRHATHAPKRCDSYRYTTEARHVATLRRLAVDELRRGNLRRYAFLLNVAHQARDALW